MSNEPKHTATPWHVEAYEVYDNQDLIIADCGLMDDLKMVEANAARIVQCVNEYDGLIETIEYLRAENAELTNKYKPLFEMLDLATYEICDAAKKYGDSELDAAAYGCIRELKQYPEFEQRSAKMDSVKQVMSERAELIEALKITFKSLCTYGSHPIIEKHVRTTLAKYEKP